MTERQSGVLMHISSLPGKYGIGSFGKSAYDFVDFLVRSKQTYWQILPLGPTSYGDSPYQSFSAFAGNTHFLDFDQFVQEGLLTTEELAGNWGEDATTVDYALIYERRRPILEKVVQRFLEKEDLSDYHRFVEEKAEWLEPFAEYMAIKESFDMKSWSNWADEEIKRRHPEALANYREKLADKLEYHRVTQYLFDKQWKALKHYANERHIQIIGDMPIYVAEDSVEMWATPHYFKTDEVGNAACVAGCPPDGFSPLGQLWGNPIYNWRAMKLDGFTWWIKRLKASFELFDVVRIDHFRGFAAYWEIPAGATDATGGQWVKGPGYDLFEAVKNELGDLPIIAEDLGFMDDAVIELREATGFPGMKILGFAFDSKEENDYLPHTYTKNCVVYTGTHDNDTLIGWFKKANEDDKQFARDYLNSRSDDEIHWDAIRGAWSSVASMAIVPIQDFLGLGSEARINTPGVASGNWQWRLKEGVLTDELAERIAKLTKVYSR